MKRVFSFILLFSFLLSACGAPAAALPTPLPTLPPTPTLPPQIYDDPNQPVEARIEDLLVRMTLDEKIGQMTQVEKNSVVSGDVTRYAIGSVLSGGGGSPAGNNTPEGWYEMVNGFQKEALATRLKIPIIYGVDAVHGHGNLLNATIFPHNIGLGAANDPELMERIGRATAEEILATGVHWNFAPMIAVAQDVRWGRTYEAYGEKMELVRPLGEAYVRGLQTIPSGVIPVAGQTLFSLATPKHYLGDGATLWGSSRTGEYELDQGNMQVNEETVRAIYLPPYKATVDAGAMSIMASFSSWKGTKMHGQKYLLTDLLKEELGFKGFIVSDWQAIDQINPDDYYSSVVISINAGVDMNMVPYDYVTFIETMHKAVSLGDIPMERIDDAVRRILRAKFALGLFENPMPDPALQSTVRSQEHLNLAREAVRKSLVLLKNEDNLLPIDKNTPLIFVAGVGADDIGLQNGGWTLEWQGRTGNEMAGRSILYGIKSMVGPQSQVIYNPSANFEEIKDEQGQPQVADLGILVIAENPYAEGVGDRADISLSAADRKALGLMRASAKKVLVILVSGRPLVLTDELPQIDALVAAWWPGTEGEGVSDVLFGDYPFTGKLSFSWPRNNEQLPINFYNSVDKTGCDAALFPFGYGLAFGESMPEIPECP
ncbi:MAG: beta-glucosidase [Chloroflexi bacterium HGW-Chloroflexi-6]|nr:MAG: beta-glucosidase [Chloroflexi bacterium HGW-Chloroflexi-6]